MIRATEIVIIAKVQNQASGQLRRLARDVASLGKADQLSRRMQQNALATQRQQARLTGVGSRIQEQQLRHSERLLQLERDLHTNMTTRMRLQQRLATVGTDTGRRLIIERQILGTFQREDVLMARRTLYAAQATNAEKALSAQLSIQETQMARLVAEEKQLVELQRLQRTAGRFQTAGRTISHIGRGATFAGLLTTAGFGAASKMFADFSTLSTKAATQIAANANKGVDAVIASGKRLEAAVQRQMQIFPASQNEMADALYQLYSSMDISEKQGIKLLRGVNQLAVATGSDLPTATNVAITTLNNFGGAGRNFNSTMDTMAAIIRLGRMELEDFDGMMNAVAPAAKGAGYSLEQMGGAMALITRLMPSQQRAATGLARLLDIFNNPDFQAGMAKAGVKITDNNDRLLDFEEIIRRIASLKPGAGLPNLIQQVTAFGRGEGRGQQGTIQARRALVLLVQNYRELHSLQGDVNSSQGEFQKRLNAMMQSPGVRWAVFVNQLRALAIEIGKDAIPAIIRLQGWIKGLIDRWHELSPGTRQAIIYFTALTGVLLLVGGPILTIVGSLVSLIGMFVLLNRTLGTGGTGVIGRLGLLIGALGTLAAIGTIVIGIKLEQKGGGWALLGKGLKLGGEAALLKRFLKVPMRRAVPGAAIFDFFANPDVAASEDTFARITEHLNNLGKSLSDNVGAKRAAEIQRGAITVFNTKLRQQGATLKDARLAVAAYLQKQGVLKASNEKGASTQDKLNKVWKDAGKLARNNIRGQLTLKEIMKSVTAQLDGSTQSLKAYNKELANWSKQRADVIRNAHEQYQNIIDTAVNNMIAKYNELKDANEQAFGTLFQGPLLTGESFQEAQDWGISPTIGIINKDLSQQINAFRKWQGDLNALAKRGAPKALIAELTQLGPEAADRVEALRKGSGKGWDKFVALWKQKQAVIQRATKQQFNQQLREWESHGKNMGLKIIAGLETEGGALENTMRNILKKSFNGNLLSEVVNEALADFMRQNPRPVKPKPKTPTGATGTTDTTPTQPRTRRGIPISRMNLRQVTRALRHDVPALRSRNAALIQLANRVTELHSPGGRRITAGEQAALTRLGHQRAGLARRVRLERRRRRHLMRRSGVAPQAPATHESGYQLMPSSPQYIKVVLQPSNTPTVVQARKAGFIVANRARRA